MTKTFFAQLTVTLKTFDDAPMRRHIEESTRRGLCDTIGLEESSDPRITISWEFFPINKKAVCTASILV